MAISNRERVGGGLDLLLAGLYPFVEREIQAKYGKNWVVAATPFVTEDRTPKRPDAKILTQDISELLKVVWNQWKEVFSATLGYAEKI